MVNMLAYDNRKKVSDELIATARDIIAYYSEEKWSFKEINEFGSLKNYFDEQPIIDLACYDVSNSHNIDFLRHVRKNGYANTLLMLLADVSMSPMEYIKPDILASELLLKPYTVLQLRDKLRDLVMHFCDERCNNDPTSVFNIESKDETTRIPYNKIYYFEARAKKLFSRTLNIEYPFYGTLDELEKALPKEFVRCHRSYIVNWGMVEKIDKTNGRIILMNNVSIPFSRTYGSIIKNMR